MLPYTRRIEETRGEQSGRGAPASAWVSGRKRRVWKEGMGGEGTATAAQMSKLQVASCSAPAVNARIVSAFREFGGKRREGPVVMDGSRT